jgi:hypothetical protein
VQGNIIEQGEGGIKQHGHCWSETSNPTISNHKTDFGSRNSAGTFNSTLVELSPNTQYYVRAYATDNEGTTYGNEINFVTKAISIPEAPGNLVADAEYSSQITISWTDNSDNEEGFKIERSPDGTTEWVEIATVGANVTSFQNINLNPSTPYYYRVRAFNPGGNSGFSNTASTTTLPFVPVPAAPQNLEGVPISNSQINLIWEDMSDNEEGFIIERSPDGSTGWTVIEVVENDIETYQNQELNSSTIYYYRVRAFNSGGESDWSNIANATTISELTLAAPTDLTAEPVSSTEIYLSWTDNSDNEEGFKIERAGESMNWREIAYVGTDTAFFLDIGLTASVIYYYRVRAFRDESNSDYSNTANATTLDETVPAAPSGLSAETKSDTEISISWTDNSNNEYGFMVEISSDDEMTWNYVGETGPDTTAGEIIGLSPGTTYSFRVYAYNAKGNSGYSNIASATTQSELTVPITPTDLTAEAVSSSQINLSWTDNSDNEEGFKIEFLYEGVPNWIQIGTTLPNIASAEVGSLSPGTLYNFRVRAYNSEGNSDYSNTADATTLADIPVPAAPTNLVAQAISDSRIDLSWTDNSDNEEGFKIERSEEGINWIAITTVAADVHIFHNIELPRSTLFYYRVRAFNPGGDSESSNIAFAETFLCPGYLLIDHIAGDVAPISEPNVRYIVVESNLSGENKCWIKQNLGAQFVAGGPTDNSQEVAGWYWQFNRKQGYMHDGVTRTPSTTWIYPIDEDSEWQPANDPCTILFGRDWRIPTQMEWQNVDNNGGWNSFIDAYASDLNLHAAGSLEFNTGNLYYRSSGGLFWSTTQSNGTRSWLMLIEYSTSMPETTFKTHGLSIRCIRD